MLLDTSAWIEYFKGTGKGGKIKGFLTERKTALYTCPITIAEISVWCYKNGEDPHLFLGKIKNLSALLELSEPILAASGKIYFEWRKTNDKIGLIDSIIYSTAVFHGLTLLTTDSDFKGLSNIALL